MTCKTQAFGSFSPCKNKWIYLNKFQATEFCCQRSIPDSWIVAKSRKIKWKGSKLKKFIGKWKKVWKDHCGPTLLLSSNHCHSHHQRSNYLWINIARLSESFMSCVIFLYSSTSSNVSSCHRNMFCNKVPVLFTFLSLDIQEMQCIRTRSSVSPIGWLFLSAIKCWLFGVKFHHKKKIHIFI